MRWLRVHSRCRAIAFLPMVYSIPNSQVDANTSERQPSRQLALLRIGRNALKADLAPREPRNLDIRGGHGLFSRKVDRRLPVLQGEVAVHLQVPAQTLDHLNADIVQCGASGNK